jgi:hypothetical protein
MVANVTLFKKIPDISVFFFYSPETLGVSGVCKRVKIYYAAAEVRLPGALSKKQADEINTYKPGAACNKDVF